MAEIGKHAWFPGPEKCPIPKHRIQVRLGVCAEQGDLEFDPADQCWSPEKIDGLV